MSTSYQPIGEAAFLQELRLALGAELDLIEESLRFNLLVAAFPLPLLLFLADCVQSLLKRLAALTAGQVSSQRARQMLDNLVQERSIRSNTTVGAAPRSAHQ